MPIRSVEQNSPIERVAEVEREAGSVEHEKRGDHVRRAARQQQHKEAADQWVGQHQEEERSEAEGEEEPQEVPHQLGKRCLDYKA